MKKFMIFAISFIILFSILQVLSGIFLTIVFTPDVNEAWHMSSNLPQQVVMKSGGNSFLPTLCVAFLSAVIAYFISGKGKKNKKHVH